MSTRYESNKEYYINKAKRYYLENKERILEQRRKYREEHKEEIAAYKKEYARKNKDKIRAYKHKYNIENREKLSEKAKMYQRNRRNDDTTHKLKMQTRHLIYMCFNKKGNIKSKKTELILGCDLDFFIQHLLKTYKNNYGIDWDEKEKVHIDHIVPLATAKSEEDIIKLCNFNNLQLLKADDNLKKSFKEVD